MKKLIMICLLGFFPLLAQQDDEKNVDSTTDIKQEQKIDVTKQYPYVSLGVGPLPIPLPVFAIGYTGQKNHHGYDVNLTLATMVEITALKQNFLYRHYFNPSYESQMYAGCGLGVTELLYKHSFAKNFTLALSPEFVIGNQFQTKAKFERFLQTQISFPYLGVNKFAKKKFHKTHALWYPVVVVSYGVAF
jgi:hypothetical protein